MKLIIIFLFLIILIQFDLIAQGNFILNGLREQKIKINKNNLTGPSENREIYLTKN